MIALAAAFIVPLVPAFFLAAFWVPGTGHRFHLAMKASLAVALSLGLSSCMYFLWWVMAGPSRGGFIATEIFLMAITTGLLLYAVKSRAPESLEVAEVGVGGARPRGAPSHSMVSHWALRIISLCAYLALATAVTRFIFLSLAAPHGEVDALTIWNLRARVLAADGDRWLDTFIALLAAHVPDYPLLVPAGIARWWTYLGEDPTLIPILIAMSFTFATIGLASSSLGFLRSNGQGFLACLVLAGTPFLIKHGASQYADVPLGFFFLAPLVLFCLQERAPERRTVLLAVAGVMTGLAAWTKNEGMLFVPVVLLARLIAVVPSAGWAAYGKEMRRFAAGLLPVLLIVVFYKWQIAPGVSRIIGEQGVSTLDKLTDASRYVETAKAFFSKAARFGHPGLVVLILYLFLLGIRLDPRDRRGAATAAAALGMMLVGYFLVIIITPHGLTYQINTSLDRLWIQLWPSAVFLFFMLVRTPEETLQSTPSQSS